MKAFCEDCQHLQEIVQGERQNELFSSHWWIFVVHKHPSKPVVCEGSGKKI